MTYAELMQHVWHWDRAGGWKDTGRIPITVEMWQEIRVLHDTSPRFAALPEWPTFETFICGALVILVRDPMPRPPLPPPVWPLEPKIPMDLSTVPPVRPSEGAAAA